MTLTFPNQMRSIDTVSGIIRFSGYDGMWEIRFAIELAVLDKLAGLSRASDASYLSAFDAARGKVQHVAALVYGQGKKTLHRLSISDF